MNKLDEKIVVLPLEYGVPKNLDKAVLYKLERKILKKVRTLTDNQYLLIEVENKLNKIKCPSKMKFLLKMKPFHIVDELLGTQGLLKYYLIEPYKNPEDIEEVDIEEVKNIVSMKRNKE